MCFKCGNRNLASHGKILMCKQCGAEVDITLLDSDTKEGGIYESMEVRIKNNFFIGL